MKRPCEKTRVIQPQAKECLQPLEAGRERKGSPLSLGGSMAQQTAWFQTSWASRSVIKHF